ncbi:MAG: hypothetical protein M1824_003791 [Vezdaea acicularis]|nr:MAG: hypothetical protein M1824_003791 [Vezdaea acicularis]
MASNSFEPKALAAAIMDAPRPTSNALLERATVSIGQLLNRFENIIALAPMKPNARNTTAVETYELEVEAAALVRAGEDLLSLTRSLKEAWLFGELRKIGEGVGTTEKSKLNEDIRVVEELALKAMRREERS